MEHIRFRAITFLGVIWNRTTFLNNLKDYLLSEFWIKVFDNCEHQHIALIIC